MIKMMLRKNCFYVMTSMYCVAKIFTEVSMLAS